MEDYYDKKVKEHLEKLKNANPEGDLEKKLEEKLNEVKDY